MYSMYHIIVLYTLGIIQIVEDFQGVQKCYFHSCIYVVSFFRFLYEAPVL